MNIMIYIKNATNLQNLSLTISTEKPLCFKILKNYRLPVLPTLRQTPVFKQLANSVQTDAVIPASIKIVELLRSSFCGRTGCMYIIILVWE